MLMEEAMQTQRPILIVGGTGKTGRRVTERLTALGHPILATSRRGDLPFDWQERAGWPAFFRKMALGGAQSAYVTYSPDLALPGADQAIAAFMGAAVGAGIRHIVLLSGRGEPEAQTCEAIVQASGAHWTILRANWFMQNFSETFVAEGLRAGELLLPAGAVPEPFIDAEDIAEVAAAALLGIGHWGRIYELSGPRALTFAEAVAEIATASGRDLRYREVPVDAFAKSLAEAGLPAEMVALVRYLFTTVLDGRNAAPTQGVQQALGRQPRDFADYARKAAAQGAWTLEEERRASPALQGAQI